MFAQKLLDVAKQFVGRELTPQEALLTTGVVAVTTLLVVVRLFGLAAGAGRAAPAALDPSKKLAFPLVAKEDVSHDTRRFTFALPSTAHRLGLPTGKHISVSATVGGKQVARPYTPTSCDDCLGTFELVVKVYAPAPPKFPDGGVMSQHLDSLALGDAIHVRGPLGALCYTADGQFSVRARGKTRVERFVHLGMIAGGTGITPMLQVIETMGRAADAGRGTALTVSLIFANQTVDDILVRAELESVKTRHPALNFTLYYTLDRPPRAWKMGRGFVDAAMIAAHLPAAGADTLVLLCGPPPMLKFACLPALAELGHDAARVLSF